MSLPVRKGGSGANGPSLPTASDAWLRRSHTMRISLCVTVGVMAALLCILSLQSATSPGASGTLSLWGTVFSGQCLEDCKAAQRKEELSQGRGSTGQAGQQQSQRVQDQGQQEQQQQQSAAAAHPLTEGLASEALSALAGAGKPLEPAEPRDEGDSKGSAPLNVSSSHLLPPSLGPLSPQLAEYIQSLHSALAAAQGRLAVCLTGAAEGLSSSAAWTGEYLISRLGPEASLFFSSRLDTGTDLLGPFLLRYAANASVAGVHIAAPLLQPTGAAKTSSMAAADETLRHAEDDTLLQACGDMIRAQELKFGFLFQWVVVAPLSVPWVGPLPPLPSLSPHALLMPSSSSGARLRAASAASDHPALQYSSRLGCLGIGFTALGARDSVLSAADAWVASPVEERCCRKCVTPAWAHRLQPGVAVQAADFPVCFGAVKGSAPRGSSSANRTSSGEGTDTEAGDKTGAEAEGPECEEERMDKGDADPSPASYWEAKWKRRVQMSLSLGMHIFEAMGLVGVPLARGGLQRALDICIEKATKIQQQAGIWQGPSPEAICVRSTALGPLLALEGGGIGAGADGCSVPTPLLRPAPQQQRPFVVYSIGGARDEEWESEVTEALSPQDQSEAKTDSASTPPVSKVGPTPWASQVHFFRFVGSVTQLRFNSCRGVDLKEGQGKPTRGSGEAEGPAGGEADPWGGCLPRQEQGGSAKAGTGSAAEGREGRDETEIVGSLKEMETALRHERIDVLKALASPSEGFSLIPFQDPKLKICLLILSTPSKVGYTPQQMSESLAAHSFELAGCSVCKGTVPSYCCAWFSLKHCL